MKNQPPTHSNCSVDCDFCKDEAELVARARKHSRAVRAAFLLTLNLESYQIVFKKALAIALAKGNHRMVRTISTGLSSIIKASK
jgi:hypothetical protein